MLKEALHTHVKLAISSEIALDLHRFGRILAVEGRAEMAARLLASGEAQYEAAGWTLGPFFTRKREEALVEIRGQLDEAALTEAWEKAGR